MTHHVCADPLTWSGKVKKKKLLLFALFKSLLDQELPVHPLT